MGGSGALRETVRRGEEHRLSCSTSEACGCAAQKMAVRSYESACVVAVVLCSVPVREGEDTRAILNRAHRSAAWCLLVPGVLAARSLCRTVSNVVLGGRVDVRYETKSLSLRGRRYRIPKASRALEHPTQQQENPQIIRLNVILAVLQRSERE